MREVLGHLAVVAIRTVRRLPEPASLCCITLLLPLYFIFRCHHVVQVGKRLSVSPFRIGLWHYYRVRARLLVKTIREHGDPAEQARNTVIHQAHHFGAALASQKPIVLCGLHLGLFERLHQLPYEEAVKYGRPLSVITAPAFSPVLDTYLQKGRSRPGKTVIHNSSTGRAVKSILRSKGVLAIMLDQYPIRQSERLFLWDRIGLPFNAKLVDHLEARGAVILPVSTWLSQNGCATLAYHPPITVSKGNAEQRVQSWKKAYREFLEREIARAPEQWNWSYPFIKRKLQL